MRFLTAIACLGAFATALPESSSLDLSIESLANAHRMGVDVWGPIPDDAVKVKDGHYTAEPGTKAWTWIRAQIDLKPGQGPQRRQIYANMGIGMFIGDQCTGQAAWYENVFYDYSYTSQVNMFSVGIRYRTLRDNERLDFSRWDGRNLCGTYLYTVPTSTPVGCFNSEMINCFRVSLNPVTPGPPPPPKK
ncbi:hypothetical protein L249_8822 [Ophiocordyceps polyrhachis-furcata BCC 54312]|uniref:Uncharacterized protein n=1 Tax=Ophiocordyceps polyrhachis-furcata BCC 54312 TaxID=1330021 RepID=A0A367L1V9_9HYPO|nr:hypothetical protein L249_8822 [Ophiocordyceps polyrhachis-furcata BCC 54312]